MVKCCLIIPYFGKFPKYFDMFLNSCKYNSNFDWLIITDDSSKHMYPENVKIKYLSFNDFKKMIQNKFDFKISLNRPYKLCDFKPSYGYVLEDDLKEYDYWGYSDLDLLLGNLNKFIDLINLSSYDKIGHLGHLTIFRNTEEINTLFMSKINGHYRYKEVFTTENICIFDEWGDMNINEIFNFKRKRILYDLKYADIYPYSSYLQIVNNNPIEKLVLIEKKIYFFHYNRGVLKKIYLKNFHFIEEEISYIHLQKRKYNCLKSNNYYILPNIFLKDNNQSKINIYLCHCVFFRIFNVKYLKNIYLTLIYKLIVLTSPFRNTIKKLF